MPSSLLARAVFGLLVVATAGAFVLTQRLKRAPPLVERVGYATVFSPNGDGRRDSVRFRFLLPKRVRATVSVVDARGERLRTLADDAPLAAGRHRFRWNGRTDAGGVAPDGAYRLRVGLRSEGRSLTAARTVTLDTVPPRPRLTAVTPSTLVPGARGAAGRVQIRYAAPADHSAIVGIHRTAGGKPAQLAHVLGVRGGDTVGWDGRIHGRAAPGGPYAFSVTARDRAGNEGHAPALPPTRASAAPGTGVTVHRLGVSGPLEPVRAGSVARFALTGLPRRFRWRLEPIGGAARRPRAARGRGAGPRLAVRVPRTARSGLWLLHVRRAEGRAVWPLAVRGARPGRAGRRVLVVLPAIAWAGRNPVDVDRDGFADTLDDVPAVPLGAPLAGGRLPRRFGEDVGPLLRMLAADRRRFELTTDLALARGRGPRLGDHRGVVFAGDERWLTAELARGVRGYVERGGRVASFGIDAFRRRVTLTPRRLAAPSPPAPENALGERTALFPPPEGPTATVLDAPVPLVAFADRIGLFGGSDGTVGAFSRLELSRGLLPGARQLSAAGRADDPDHPAFIAYRLGRGIVVRPGASGWGAAAATRPDVAEVTRRIWALLSR